ncbi:hypothetical protein GF322_04300 [Candidatus Dependentiae bacterium]|nr:hypothetical protein [Candidatus Dependentiae bacterium]
MKFKINKYVLFLYSIVFSFSFITVFSEDSNTALKALDNNTNLVILKNAFENLKDLDYYNSTKLSVLVPGGRQLNLDWGFKGSGDILEAFPDINISVVNLNKELDVGLSGKDNKFNWAVFAKIVAQNKFKNLFQNELQEYFSGISWFLSPKASPLKIFALKLFLLLKHPFPDGFEFKRKIEILRLLFRLSQSNISEISNINRPLSSYFPKALVQILEDNVSVEWRQFIDQAWNSFAKGLNDYKFKKDGSYDKDIFGRYVKGFVFDNNSVAQACYNSLSKKIGNISDLDDEISKIAGSKYEIIDYSDYDKYGALKNYNFIGSKDFGRMNIESKIDNNIPEQIKKVVFSVHDLPAVIKFEESDNRIWLLYISEKLYFLDSIKLLCASLLDVFKNYKKIKATLPENDYQEDNNQNEIKLAEFTAKKQDLNNKINALFLNLQEEKKNLIKKKKNSTGSILDLNLIEKSQDKINDLEKQISSLKIELIEVEKQIKIIEKNPYDIFGINNNSENKKNIFNFIINAVISSPEFNGMLKDLSYNSKYFKELKEDLFKKIVCVLKNTENLKSNLEIYRYLISTILPEFKDEFENMTKELEEPNLFLNLLNG